MTKTTSNEVEAFLALFFVFFMGDANQILSDFILGWLINFFHNGLFDYFVIKKLPAEEICRPSAYEIRSYLNSIQHETIKKRAKNGL